ncbi:hypothetical protein [Bacillus sp. 165]|uniref:hypothetical protein n=1 Tax=Bacillus sp. 165 TaxID=1529117 RepID=UPI001ADB4D3E|nr:hypothetical protein [Bacillus sp. 165]MBO9129133.1 hypothetical protein [Bacillus sp. 165]
MKKIVSSIFMLFALIIVLFGSSTDVFAYSVGGDGTNGNIIMLPRGHGWIKDSKGNLLLSGNAYQNPNTYEVVVTEGDALLGYKYPNSYSIGHYAIFNPGYAIAVGGVIYQYGKSNVTIYRGYTSYGRITGYTFRLP